MLSDAQFTDSQVDLLLPLLDPAVKEPTIEDILTAPERPYALYDEQLIFYLILRLPDLPEATSSALERIAEDPSVAPGASEDHSSSIVPLQQDLFKGLTLSVESLVTEMTNPNTGAGNPMHGQPFSPFLVAPTPLSPFAPPPRRSSSITSPSHLPPPPRVNSISPSGAHGTPAGPSYIRRRPSFQSVIDAEGSGSGVVSAGLEETRVSARNLEHVERKSRRWIGRSEGGKGGWVVAWEVKMELDYVKSASGKSQNLTLTLNMAKERQTHWITPGLVPSSGHSGQRTLPLEEGEGGGEEGVMVTPATPLSSTADAGILMGRRSPSPTPSNASIESAPASATPGTTLRPELPSSSSDAGGRKTSLLSVLTSRSTDSLVSEGLSAIHALHQHISPPSSQTASVTEHEPSQASNPSKDTIKERSDSGSSSESRVKGGREGSGSPDRKRIEEDADEDEEGGQSDKDKGSGKRQSQQSLIRPGGAPSSLGRRPSIKEAPALFRRSNTMLLSVDLANEKDAGHSYILYGVDVEIANAAVRYLGERIVEHDPVKVGPREQYSAIYHVKLLEEGTVPTPMAPSTTPAHANGALPPRSPMSGSMMSPMFSPTPVNPHLREVTIQLDGAPFHGEAGMDRRTRSQWCFPLDVSDAEKRRVQELFKGNGPRTRLVWPPPPTPMPVSGMGMGLPSSGMGSPRMLPFGQQRRPTVVRAISEDGMEGMNSGSGPGSAPGSIRGGKSGLGPGVGPGNLRVRTGGLGVNGPGNLSPLARPSSPLASPSGVGAGQYPTPTSAALRKKAFTLVGGNSAQAMSTAGVVGSAPGVQGATEFGGGVVVSFSVTGKVVHGRMFSVEAFLVNRSARIKNFTVSVPSRQRGQRRTTAAPPHLQIGTKREKVHSTEMGGPTHGMKIGTGEMVTRYVEGQKNDASLLSMDTHVRLSPLMPASCQSVHLRFKPFREGFNMVELIQLYDNDTGTITSLRDVVEVYVHPVEIS
ncbi:hypothetical protein BJ684DRAFT_20583 [Piptocephalis cylindrospora]|uniref:Trafficking protein particle complex II-specific subunit 65 IgD3 domain-containing protein n=1 Tax=Piptocephalis cylindrospora TaxID=1907219 RepID=A0A4P9Y2J2_9FUNG|nr:hypothetical protein BJ684DRAFT_20583 [Piptocephalis cylindrospora]|eukprot:RKP12894.1 hypothetical protein BJ684DRAFT_20583 [Piptocephalis cylindrospora]